MKKAYESKVPDKDGLFQWTAEENAIWNRLISRQIGKAEEYAHPKFLEGLRKLNLDVYHIPQHTELDKYIFQASQWHIQAVPSIIDEEIFFGMLSEKIFPVTSFIRRTEDIDYIEEPDIFHEVFGHLPLLTWNEYGDFLEKFGKTYLSLSGDDKVKMGKLFWFTIEFGLIRQANTSKIYGAGILSSYNETPRSVDNMEIQRTPFDVGKCISRKYRYDILQDEYFVLESFGELFSLFDENLISILNSKDSM